MALEALSSSSGQASEYKPFTKEVNASPIFPVTSEGQKSLHCSNFTRPKSKDFIHKAPSPGSLRKKTCSSAQPQFQERKNTPIPRLSRLGSRTPCSTISAGLDRNQGPRFKSTLYRTSSPGPGENVVKFNTLELPTVGKRKMRAVAIKTFDIDQGHFLVYVRADPIRYEMSKHCLKPVVEEVTVGKVKNLAGKYLNLLPASLNMFGIFAGELGRPTVLYQDTDPLPNDIDQFCFQRLNFISNDEVAITKQDSRAMELVFWEVKNVFENGKIWPMMKQPQWKKLFDVSAECQKEWITKSVIPFQTMTKFIETLRVTIPLFYWSCYYWCHCVLHSRLKGREKGTEVMVIPDINELTIYDTTLGKKFVSWSWSKIVSIRLNMTSTKLLIFDVLFTEEKSDTIRDIAITSDQGEYIFTIVIHIINLLEERRARYCHYPLGILWNKRKRVAEMQGEFCAFSNKALCESMKSISIMDYAVDNAWKELQHRRPENLSTLNKDNKPIYHLQPISIQGSSAPLTKPVPIREKFIFTVSQPMELVREITIFHYFNVKPITLTVAVTPTGESRVKVYQIQREIGTILGISDRKGSSIFGLFKDENGVELLADDLLLPLSSTALKTCYLFKRLSFSASLEDSIIDNDECALKGIFGETFHIISNSLNKPSISMKHFSALTYIISSGNRNDSKPSFHQMAEFMKYVYFHTPFYWQSFYGAPTTVANNSALADLTETDEVFLAMNIHKLEILSNNFESKQIGSWLWVKVHSVERSKLDDQLITFKGFYGKQKQLIKLSFHSQKREYLFSIAVHILKLLAQKYNLVSSSKKEDLSSEKADIVFNTAFFMSDRKLEERMKLQI